MNSLPGLSRRYTQFPTGSQGRLAETPKRKLSIVIRGGKRLGGTWAARRRSGLWRLHIQRVVSRTLGEEVVIGRDIGREIDDVALLMLDNHLGIERNALLTFHHLVFR